MRTIIFSTIMTLAMAPLALADDVKTIQVVIQNHIFTPSEIKVPAKQNVTLHIKNMDNESEEFDSDDLKVEKVIAANSEGNVHLRELDKGKYNFMGEYHSDTAHGTITAE